MTNKVIVIFMIIIVSLVGIVGMFTYDKYLDSKMIINLDDNLEIEVYSKVKISDLVKDREIIDDYVIDTDSLGIKEIEFSYKNNGFRYTDSLMVEVVDTTSPRIFLNKTYTIYKDGNIDLVNSVICGDNYTNKPNCYIDGDYDTGKVGNYSLTYVGIDETENKTVRDFTLIVKEKDSNMGIKREITKFEDVVDKYEGENIEIGIDVSKWQGDIDFEAVKGAGVEFVMIKIAGRNSINGEIGIEPYFYRNIEKALENDLRVGVYFYSRASSVDEALEEAGYVLDIIKDYDIKMGVAFDWENWSDFNDYEVSFHLLNEIAINFLGKVKNEGYRAWLYGSEYYLKNIWDIDNYEIWLARYADKVDYDKEYVMWQLSNTGRVDGIEGAVDIDVLYK